MIMSLRTRNFTVPDRCTPCPCRPLAGVVRGEDSAPAGRRCTGRRRGCSWRRPRWRTRCACGCALVDGMIGMLTNLTCLREVSSSLHQLMLPATRTQELGQPENCRLTPYGRLQILIMRLFCLFLYRIRMLKFVSPEKLLI